jgi:cytoskeletal protein CcmA (bactofilin family)
MAAATVIGPGTVIRGNVRGDGGIEILGKVEGDVSVNGDVVLGESSAVKGNVSGARISLAGAVQGDIQGTDAVLVERGARVVGDLLAPRIGIASGALVRGNVRTEGEPELPAMRRGLAAHAPRLQPQPRPVILEAVSKPVAPRASSNSAAEDSPEKSEQRPPAPVVPALSKGARGHKRSPKRAR